MEADQPDLGQEREPSSGAHRLWRYRWTDLSSADRDEVLDQLFFEGPALVSYLSRYATLMVLSVIIASLGLVGDSTAVVIGAMIIAPLMTPILALAAALVMAWPRRQLVAALILLGGCVGGVAVAWLVSSVLPAERFVVLPNELLARTNPTLLDLGIGLAAGAAGAYVTVRTKVGSAIAGVAIAVALVPPLAAIGILLQRGEGRLAAHAALLLLTNITTITLSGAVVFLVTGFTPKARADRLGNRIGLGFATALLAVAVVAYPLALASTDLITREKEQSTLEDQVTLWLTGRNTQIQEIEVGETDRYRVAVDLSGSDPPPAPEPLASVLAHKLNHPVDLVVRYTPSSEQTAHGTPATTP
jgi:uncharacterized hydrophobic protein (TIGR00271 family)